MGEKREEELAARICGLIRIATQTYLQVVETWVR